MYHVQSTATELIYMGDGEARVSDTCDYEARCLGEGSRQEKKGFCTGDVDLKL